MLAAGVVCASANVTSAAPAGEPDPSFGAGGVALYQLGFGQQPFSQLSAIAAAPGGKLDVAGVSGNGGGGFQVLTARLNEDGALDPTYGSGGALINRPVEDPVYPGRYSEYANALAVQPDGSLIAAGNVIERITSVGQFDPSFSPNQDSVVEIEQLTILPEGKLLVSGSQNQTSQVYAAEVERLLTNGQPDRSFGEAGLVKLPVRSEKYCQMRVHSATRLTNGDIIISGNGSYANLGTESSHPFLWLARLTPSGTLDKSFGTNGLIYIEHARGRGQTLQVAGGLVLVGKSMTAAEESEPFAETPNITVWGFTLNGTPNTAFGKGGTSVIGPTPGYNRVDIWAATVDPAGRPVLAGRELDITTAVRNPVIPLLIRLNPDGSPDPTFGHGGEALGGAKSEFAAVGIDQNGRIVVAGTHEDPEHEYSLVERFLSTEASPPPPTPPFPTTSPTGTPGATIANASLAAYTGSPGGGSQAYLPSPQAGTADLHGTATFKTSRGKLVIRLSVTCASVAGSGVSRCVGRVVRVQPRVHLLSLEIGRSGPIHATIHQQSRRLHVGTQIVVTPRRHLRAGTYVLSVRVTELGASHSYSSPLVLR
ncbi:MAG TPA: hypothetical protein VGO14_02660 [Solirubrobacteraceae bacterium]|nr:hypothetical protein [Solirubrobacteraceae bacterium]